MKRQLQSHGHLKFSGDSIVPHELFLHKPSNQICQEKMLVFSKSLNFKLANGWQLPIKTTFCKL